MKLRRAAPALFFPLTTDDLALILARPVLHTKDLDIGHVHIMMTRKLLVKAAGEPNKETKQWRPERTKDSSLHITHTMTSSVVRLTTRYATINNVAGEQRNFRVSNTTINSATNILDILPYAEGASWNPQLVCLQDTRRELFDDIWRWIYTADETKRAEIFWLCDVAGAGKSALAHTVALNCFHEGVLASSFFFDRNIPDRRSPQKLFSTIARDLVGLSKDLVRQVSHILENDRSVASASQSRQFTELILKPACRHCIGRPVVIVIDGLDEGCDRETLSILRHQVPKLPGTFRILVTSRPTDDIRTDLSNISHVQHRSFDIHGDVNQRDIGLYIRDRLRYISTRKQLGTDWPGEQRILDFTRQAEGLFVWVSTVSEYLLTAAYADRKLSALLYDKSLRCLPAEAKMRALYAEVLSTCDWGDQDFSLHRKCPTLEVDEVLRPLSSVLTGFVNDGHPIRILHLSFRDFLAYHGQFPSVHECFQVNEREHSQRLVLSCLHVLNEDLTADIRGTGYLTTRFSSELTVEVERIPLDGSQVTEVLWYACRFWTEHILDVEGPVSDAFLAALRQFLTEKLIIWIEVLNSRYPFQTLYAVREWLQKTFPSETVLIVAISGNQYSQALLNLSKRLSTLRRREDALNSILEATHLTVCPSVFRILDAEKMH
ncbi:hypothetical protein PILCRDRAFT_6526 [Piloderma croceum F 1598]|uniref:Nephrocystin 3-like N-terminal domain-containing protein n=1 Tax=Piloderma croceum (strain F 1598) TaxID=765440 RepID=A0A0C3G0Q2_PILCF|nr:hypothetical protein PILCRDRAFT_6526 [Piloderma croceum F 1598]